MPNDSFQLLIIEQKRKSQPNKRKAKKRQRLKAKKALKVKQKKVKKRAKEEREVVNGPGQEKVAHQQEHKHQVQQLKTVQKKEVRGKEVRHNHQGSLVKQIHLIDINILVWL